MKSLLIVLFTSGLLVGCSVPDSVNFIPIPSFKGAKKSADGTAAAMKKSGEAIADVQPTTSQTKNVDKDYKRYTNDSILTRISN